MHSTQSTTIVRLGTEYQQRPRHRRDGERISCAWCVPLHPFVLYYGPHLLFPSHSYSYLQWTQATVPVWVEQLKDMELFEISTGRSHTVILTKRFDSSGGKLWSFGLGKHGRLGYVKNSEIGPPPNADEEEAWFTLKPGRIYFPDPKMKVARVACGADHTLAVSEHGELYAWGQGESGALGLGHSDTQWEPDRVYVGQSGEFIIHMAAGSKHSVCCTRSGVVYAWGHGGNGRLGLGHNRYVIQA